MGLSDLIAIFANDSENLYGMILQILRETLMSLILDLLIKEPLVDLYPREACSFHGFSTPFAVHAAAGLGK